MHSSTFEMFFCVSIEEMFIISIILTFILFLDECDVKTFNNYSVSHIARAFRYHCSQET